MNEENSVDFYFVSRRHMEHNIQNNKLVEHAFYEGHYYGTSIDSIRKVINEGKTCLLIVAPQSIRSVRTPEIKPFLVYLKPPTADFMKQTWVQQKRIKVFLCQFPGPMHHILLFTTGVLNSGPDSTGYTLGTDLRPLHRPHASLQQPRLSSARHHAHH